MLWISLSLEAWFIANSYAIFKMSYALVIFLTVWVKLLSSLSYRCYQGNQPLQFCIWVSISVFQVFPTNRARFTYPTPKTRGKFTLCTSVVFLTDNHVKLAPLASKIFKIGLEFQISNNRVFPWVRCGHKGGTPSLFFADKTLEKRPPGTEKKWFKQDWCFTIQKIDWT